MSGTAAEGRRANRLANETSPYLLQHQYNPVDWYPWGDEAIERARREDRPILLSVGYSSCHWCHVMERESFEDDATAELMNERYVNVKVDREERPDIDEIYMSSVQLMTGQGGWPMTVFLTPDKLEPFYSGTYFPPDERMGLPSFRRVLTHVSDAFRERRDEVTDSAGRVAQQIAGMSMIRAGETGIDPSAIDSAAAELLGHYDRVNGGFGGAPKFPASMSLSLLLRVWRRTGDDKLLEPVTHSLRRMACGGMYDQLGGGFHRYAVDDRWLVPHFEKMLYDNALLAQTYTEAWQATGDATFARVARETLDWVLREMVTAEGAFCASLDADTDGEEGKTYVWSLDEIQTLLGDGAAEFASFYDVTRDGNFEGASILNVTGDPAPIADPDDELGQRLAKARARLLEVRATRPQPGLDDKVILDWNGMMIGAMARGYQVFGEDRWLEAARKAARFLLDNLRTEDGEWLRTWREGRGQIPAFQTDLAALLLGMLDLYESDFDLTWLEAARDLADRMIRDFEDREHGGFFYVSERDATPVTRTKNPFDNATPSGNSLAAHGLLRLSRISADGDDYLRAAEAAVRLLSDLAVRMPAGFSNLLCALDAFAASTSSPEIVVAPGGAEDRAAMLAAIRRPYAPDKIVLEVPSGDATDTPIDPTLVAGRDPVDGRTAAYICRNRTCSLPTCDPADVAGELRAPNRGETS